MEPKENHKEAETTQIRMKKSRECNSEMNPDEEELNRQEVVALQPVNSSLLQTFLSQWGIKCDKFDVRVYEYLRPRLKKLTV